MKLFRLFGLLSIIALLIVTQGVLKVRAETITKDFGQTNFNSSDYSGHNIFCTIEVVASIQTEPNGNWIANNTYEVNWTITMAYLNQSLYDSSNFWIVCYNPVNTVYSTVGQNAATPQTTVTPQKSGELIVIFKPSAAINFMLDSSFSLTVYYKGNIVTSGSWEQSFNNQPITINVVSNQQASPSPTVPELTTLTLGVTLAIVTGSIALYSRKVKSRQEYWHS